MQGIRGLCPYWQLVTCDGTGKVARSGLPCRCLEKFKVGMTIAMSPSNSWKAYLRAGASESLGRYSSKTVGIISGGTSWSKRSSLALFRSHSSGRSPIDFSHPEVHVQGTAIHLPAPVGCSIRLCLGRINSSVEVSVSPVVTVCQYHLEQVSKLL